MLEKMNRRNFLLGTLGVPVIPLLAQATKFSCIVGDFRQNLNGHIYSKDMWMSMFTGVNGRKTLCCLENEQDLGQVIGVPLLDIAGVITEFHIGTSNITVTMESLDTPKGRILRTLLLSKRLYYLTPCGYGKSHIDSDGQLRIEGYRFTHFGITETSAFECATPLQMKHGFGFKDNINV